MYKKILLVSAITALGTSLAYASAAPYVGGSIGIINNSIIIDTTSSSALLPSFRGVPFKFFAGYGGIINQNFYLAGELEATVGTASVSNNNDVTRSKYSYSYGVSLIPGAMLSDHTLLFARAGMLNAHLPSINASKIGGEFGAGLQTSLTQNVDIRGEYDYVIYKSFKDTTTGTSFQPQSDQVSLAIIYKFD